MFLDRDGVINQAVVRNGKPYPPASPAELRILPGVPEAIAALSEAGLRVIVVTNQPDVATGVQTRAAVEEMHEQLRKSLALDDVKVCFHVDADDCACRKPRPGMLLDAARDQGIDLERSFLVGDRWRDVEAGQAVGCRTYFVDRAYSEKRPAGYDLGVGSLREAAEDILARLRAGR